MAASKLVPVSKRALLARINRKLAHDGEMVKATRGERWRDDLGDFYTIDISRNLIIDKQIDLEDRGRELGVLKAYERLSDE